MVAGYLDFSVVTQGVGRGGLVMREGNPSERKSVEGCRPTGPVEGGLFLELSLTVIADT